MPDFEFFRKEGSKTANFGILMLGLIGKKSSERATASSATFKMVAKKLEYFFGVFSYFFDEFLSTPSVGFFFFHFFKRVISVPHFLKQILTPSRFWAFGPKSFGGRI